MRMRSALLTVIVMAAMFCGHPPASEAQDQVQQRPGPRGPGLPVGGVPRPDPTGQPRRPVRDPRQPPAEGTATIRGRVVDGATGQAIPRAKVRMANRDPRTARVATTDTEGVFTLTKVPSGPLALTVEKITYLPAFYPERRRTMRISSQMVMDGQTIDNINIPLFRGGVITGRVVDAYGDPVENAMVQVIYVPQGKGGASPLNRGGVRSSQSTNDIGEFRVARLEPGQYYLLAMPQRHGPSSEDTGSAPGRTWYPGVASMDQAQPVTLERGTSLTGLDFQMLDTTLTKVSGSVLTAKGVPARGGNVTVRATAASKGMPAGFGGWGGPDAGGGGLDQYGNFDLTLQPGEYVFEAMVWQGEEGPRQGRSEMDRGQIRLTVGTEPMSGVMITTGTGGTASGRFVFKGTSAPPDNVASFNISFSGPNGTMGEDCRVFNRTAVNPDGTFSAENMWGTCQIRGGGMAKGWIFESVMHNGNDITNRAIDFGGGRSISGIEVVFTDRIGEVSVTVSDERGAPTEDFVAVLFPVEKEKWSDWRFLRTQASSPTVNQNAPGQGGFTAGRVMATGMNQMSFAMGGMMGGPGGSMRNLLAGDYFVIAVEDVGYEDLRDPEFLERLSQDATRVTVRAGSAESVQLRRIRLPE